MTMSKSLLGFSVILGNLLQQEAERVVAQRAAASSDSGGVNIMVAALVPIAAAC